MARKSIYEKYNWDEKLDLVRKWARQGLTDEEICQKMGISHDTIYKYKKRYPEFAEALKESKKVADAKVEQALYKNATGFNYTEQVLAANGEIKEVERFAKPQTSAQKVWLKNRQPDIWEDKQKIEAEVDMNPISAVLAVEEDIE